MHYGLIFYLSSRKYGKMAQLWNNKISISFFHVCSPGGDTLWHILQELKCFLATFRIAYFEFEVLLVTLHAISFYRAVKELMCILSGYCGSCGGLMVSALDSGSSGPFSNGVALRCVLGKTLYSHNASLHPGV